MVLLEDDARLGLKWQPVVMIRPRSSDLGLVVVAAAVATTLELRAAVSAQALVNATFVAVMLTALLALGRTVGRSVHESAVSRREAVAAARLVPHDVAATAVRAERERLMVEIHAIVRSSLEVVCTRIAGVGTHPRPVEVVRQVQAEARAVMTELRRELGLLHGPLARGVSPVTPVSAGPPARDYWLVGAVLALAIVETLVQPGFEGIEVSWRSRVLAALFAVTLIGRAVAPALAAAAAIAVLTVGAVSGHDVPDGFFFPAVVAPLLWGLITRAAPANLASATVLVVAVCVSRQVYEPVNLGINVTVMAVTAVAALVQGRVVGRTRRVKAESAARLDHVAAVTEDAVGAERRSVAREVHDVASHAVSLIAVQAGAAEMLWDSDPDAALRAAGEIDAIARGALRELESLRPGVQVAEVTWSQVEALADRMRAAGLDVHLAQDGVAPPVVMATLHRVIQEALTNALRHAPGSSVWVRAATTATEVRVDVTDDGRGAPERGQAHGFGLLGLGERVRQAGGTLSAGQCADGGFAVRAVLPLPMVSSPGADLAR